jgi:subtilisin-like proprotein convertase family protein
MRSDRSQRLVRVLQTSSIVLGVVVACTVADKSDYEFTDEPAKGGGSNGGASGASGVSGSSSGTTGKGGSSGDGGGGGEETGGTGGSGTAGKGGTSGKGGNAGTGGTSGDSGTAGAGGEETGGTATGGSAGGPTGRCGDGNLDSGEDCDDNNTVTEPCAYHAARCGGCSAQCRSIRPPTCGDGMKNGANAQAITLEYLASSCATGSGASPNVPLYLNGVPIPGLPWGAGCACQPGIQQISVTDQAVLGALRQSNNVISFLSKGADEYIAWANVTAVFDNGERITQVAYDFGDPGDATARNLGPAGPCTIPLPPTFFGYGISDGPQFGGFPIEQCDGPQNCRACSLEQCVSLTSTRNLAIPDASTTGAPGVVTDTILMPQLGTVRDVNVTLNINHQHDGDLSIQLTAVTNQQILLVDRRGGVGSNFLGTLLDSQCSTPIANALAPFNGCFQPDTSLDVFNGFPSTIGYWTLTVKDGDSNGFVGSLTSWTLKICGSP